MANKAAETNLIAKQLVMKKLTLLALSCALPLCAMQNPPPMPLLTTLNTHQAELIEFATRCSSLVKEQSFLDRPFGLTNGLGATCYKWEAGYFVKYHVDRIEGAEILRKAIIENGLTHLIGVPDKYLWHIPNQPQTLNDENYLVISKKIDADPDQILTLEHVLALETLYKTTGFYDARPDNLILSKGKLYIIDTGCRFYTLPSKILAHWIFPDKFWHQLKGNKNLTSKADNYLNSMLVAAADHRRLFKNTLLYAGTAFLAYQSHKLGYKLGTHLGCKLAEQMLKLKSFFAPPACS